MSNKKKVMYSYWRGFGQILLQANPWSGILVIGGIFWGSVAEGVAAVLAGMIAFVFSCISRFPAEDIDSGSYVFNAALLGICMTHFFEVSFRLELVILIGSVAVTMLWYLARLVRFPAFTFPFVGVSWLVLLCSPAFGLIARESGGSAATGADAAVILARGMGQVVLQSSPVSGLFFLAAILVGSRVAVGFAMAGAAMGLAIAWLAGVSRDGLETGLFCYNPILAALAFAGKEWRDVGKALLAALISIVLTALMVRRGIVVLTFPFVAASWTVVGITKKKWAILTSLLLLGTVVSAQQQKVEFAVVDRATREPLEWATAYDPLSGKTQMTNKEGCFTMTCRSGDSLCFMVSFLGYKPQEINIRHPDKRRMVIEMEKGAVSLKEITVQNHSFTHHFNPLSLIDLNRNPAKSAQDLLRLVPGLFIAQHQGGGKAEQIFLRGFDADHGTDVNISVDGMPVNLVSHAHGQGYADLHFLIPETVAGYDFGKGSYYTDKGDFTTAGYVSYSTRNVLDRDMVKIEGGQFHTGRVLGMFNLLRDSAKMNGKSAYVAVDGVYSNGGPFITPEHFRRLNLYGKWCSQLGAYSKLMVEAATMTTKWEASGEIPDRAVAEGYIPNRFGAIDPFQGGASSREHIIVRLVSNLGSGLSLENEAYAGTYYFDLVNNFTFYDIDSIHGDEFDQHERRKLGGYMAKLSHRMDWRNMSLRSVAGVGLRYDRTDPTWLTHTEKAQFLSYLQLGNVRELNAYAYLDETLETGRWLIDAGLREDVFNFYYLNRAPESDTAAEIFNGLPDSRSKGILCPKLNVEYSFNPGLQLYLKTGRGFHSNDVRIVIPNKGYETLPPAYGADLGVNWKPVPELWLNTAIWYLYLRQEFTYGQDFGDLSVEPGGRTVRKGIDFSARWEISRWLFAGTNLNWAIPRCIDSSAGHRYLALAPTFTSTAALDFTFRNGINGGLSYRYLHNRSANSDYSLTALGYFVTDLTVNYTRKTYELGLSAENLLNQVWDESQYAYVSRLEKEKAPVYQVSYTPGDPFFLKLKLAVFF